MTWPTFLVVLFLLAAASGAAWCVGYGLAGGVLALLAIWGG